ncbi:MAG: TolC family protein, partial [Candidatus Gastranaerophilales bacterium]|nr:TolC family protein [Candidatus Gastranaerophilales bacterium]
YIENRNIDVNMAKEEINEAKGLYIKSFGPFLPSLKMQYSAEKFNGGEVYYYSEPITIDRTTYRPTLAVDYSIHTGGRAFWELGYYKNQLKKYERAYDRTVQKTLLDSVSAYFTWLKSFADMELAEQQLSEAKERLNLAKSRFKNGFGEELDISKAQNLVNEKENKFYEIQHNNDIAEIYLAVMLNLEHFKRITPANTRIKPINFINEEKTAETYFADAKEKRPDIKEAIFAIKEAENEHKAAVSDIFPTISLSAYTRGIGDDMDTLRNTKQAMIAVNMNLLNYMGLNIAGNVKQGKSKLKQAILRKQKILNESYKSLNEVYYQNQLLKNKLTLADQKVITAKKNYEIFKEKFKKGTAINLDVVRAKTGFIQARCEYEQIAMESNLAQLKLLYEAGILTPEAILNSIVLIESN